MKVDFRVAILLPRTMDADGWTRSGYAGLLLIKKELGAEIADSGNISETDFENPVSQKLTEANGGRPEVKSEVGKGSTVTVWLPVYGHPYNGENNDLEPW